MPQDEPDWSLIAPAPREVSRGASLMLIGLGPRERHTLLLMGLTLLALGPLALLIVFDVKNFGPGPIYLMACVEPYLLWPLTFRWVGLPKRFRDGIVARGTLVREGYPHVLMPSGRAYPVVRSTLTRGAGERWFLIESGQAHDLCAFKRLRIDARGGLVVGRWDAMLGWLSLCIGLHAFSIYLLLLPLLPLFMAVNWLLGI